MYNLSLSSKKSLLERRWPWLFPTKATWNVFIWPSKVRFKLRNVLPPSLCSSLDWISALILPKSPISPKGVWQQCIKPLLSTIRTSLSVNNCPSPYSPAWGAVQFLPRCCSSGQQWADTQIFLSALNFLLFSLSLERSKNKLSTLLFLLLIHFKHGFDILSPFPFQSS